MPKCHRSWTVLPHRPLEKLEANLWRVEGDLPNGGFKRVMTVARMRDGGLVIHNAICVGPGLMAELEAFGTPRVLVVPNGYHRLDALVWKQRYPQVRVIGGDGLARAPHCPNRLAIDFNAAGIDSFQRHQNAQDRGFA